MKIKNIIIPKLHTLTRKEMDLFFYLAKRMDQATGYVEGVYYRDVMAQEKMCKQSFYNALWGLAAKEIIKVEKVSRVDYNVLILENAFPTRESCRAYVKLNRKAFRSKAFQRLKAHEKYMLLDFLKRTHENSGTVRIKLKDFYKEYTGLLGVTEPVLRGYLHNLKEFFHIGINCRKYIIRYCPDVFSDRPYKNQKSEEAWCHEHLVEKECRRNHISCGEDKTIHDTAYLATQYRGLCAGGTKEALQLLMRCIRESIEGLERKDRRLQVKYIHKLMRKALGLPETAPIG